MVRGDAFDAGFDDDVGWLGNGFGKHVEGDPGGAQRLRQPLEQARRNHERVADDERVGQAEPGQQRGNAGNLAATDFDQARRVECHLVHQSLSILVRSCHALE